MVTLHLCHLDFTPFQVGSLNTAFKNASIKVCFRKYQLSINNIEGISREITVFSLTRFYHTLKMGMKFGLNSEISGHLNDFLIEAC